MEEEENPSRCEECEYYATRTDLLQNHIKSVHEKILRYSCAYCTYASFFRNTVRHHLKSTHPSEELYIKKIGCIECETDSNHSHTVERRAINQTSEQNCNLCGLKCSGNSALKRHLIASHPGTKMFKCNQCSYEYNWRWKVRVHKTNLHGQASNECDRCVFKMKLNPLLLEHRRKEHGMFIRKPKEHEEMQLANNLCEFCGFPAWSIKEQRRHMPDVLNDKEVLICQKCDELFKKEEVLWFHMTGKHKNDRTCRMIEILGNKLGPSWTKD